jgi:hypothetical protein
VRTPKEVIDNAIQENAKWDWARYLMAGFFTLTAIGALVVGVWINEGWPVAAGAAATAGAWRSIRFVHDVWATNISLRMIELSLSDKRTAKDALNDLRAIYRRRSGLGGE